MEANCTFEERKMAKKKKKRAICTLERNTFQEAVGRRAKACFTEDFHAFCVSGDIFLMRRGGRMTIVE